MIEAKQATASLGRMALLKFFPADDEARAELVRLAGRMARTNEQIDWLVTRCLALWNQWEGPREFRAVFCSKFRAADGVEAESQLPQFADGIPSELAESPWAPQLPAGAEPLRLTAGECAPEEFRATVAELATATDMRRVLQRRAIWPVHREADEPPPLSAETRAKLRADMALAEREYRERKARQELGIVEQEQRL